MNRDAGVMQDQYGYDANGNVTAITDQQEGVFSRSMGYDDLDWLVSTSALKVWGGAITSTTRWTTCAARLASLRQQCASSGPASTHSRPA